MEFNYQLDIEQISKRIIITAHSLAKELPFQIIECGLFHASENYYTTGNHMENFLLMYTVGGTGRLVYDGIDITLSHNTVAIIELNQPFHYETLGQNWIFQFIQFNGASAKAYYDLITQHQRYCIPISEPDRIERAFQQILSLPSVADINASIAASHATSAILTGVVENMQRSLYNRMDARQMAGIQKVLDHIRDHYWEEFSLSQIASLTNTSKYYLLRLFKAHTGLTPYNYLLNYRINQAQLLLKTTDLTVASIAEQVGFSSDHVFIKHFKKITSITPLQYRKQEQKQISCFVPTESDAASL